MTPAEEMERLAARAREAARAMSRACAEIKTRALIGLADQLAAREEEILTANRKDLDAARAAGLDAPRLDRLTLTPAIMAEMRAACLHVAQLPDPVGVTEQQWQQPNGLLVGRMRIPLGVIAMIYEARPNVTIDAAILCIKAGNAVILRGGSEALHSNTALAGLLQTALSDAGLPPQAAQLVGITGHAAVTALCKLDRYIDVIIPRGGEGLVRAVTEAATMPVLKHFKGVCHALSTRMRIRIRPWRSSSTPRCSGPACATPWNACWCTRTRQRTFCRWRQRNWAPPGWNSGPPRKPCPCSAPVPCFCSPRISARSSTP